jgi:hypothetical protein
MMLVRILLVASCVACGSTQHTSERTPRSAPHEVAADDSETELSPADNSSEEPDYSATANVGASADPPATRVRVEEFVEETAIPGVEVRAERAMLMAWNVTVKNTNKESAEIRWDESSFVAGNGESLGRLLRGSTRKFDMGNAQPATPLPKGSSFSETVLPERALEAIKQVRMRSANTSSISEPEIQDQLVGGGRLNLVLQVGNKKHTWTGRIELK